MSDFIYGFIAGIPIGLIVVFVATHYLDHRRSKTTRNNKTWKWHDFKDTKLPNPSSGEWRRS